MATVLATGGFDPLHSGHLEYLEAAQKLGDRLIVGVNSDGWLIRKKGKFFLPYEERAAIIKNLRYVDEVIRFDDSDGSATDAITKMLISDYLAPSEFPILFVNGGDRSVGNSPEWERYNDDSRVVFVDSVGSSIKRNSSSDILRRWDNHKNGIVRRKWGYYTVLREDPHCRVKQLVIEPGQTITMQKHHHRSELWLIEEGSITLDLKWSHSSTNTNRVATRALRKYNAIIINEEVWHEAKNTSDTDVCKVIEIQHGENCVEEDIVRASEMGLRL